MRSKFILTSGLAAVLLWSFNANAEQETACVNAKLSTASRYTQCMIRAFNEANVRKHEPSEDIVRCDEKFDRAFERAEAHGGCHTAGGASPVRDSIKEQVLSTFTNFAVRYIRISTYLNHRLKQSMVEILSL
jgi:hypothetical protein